eukprot:CAMPEP_0198144270 /NCGR_PEP_ID=MMETSP1443-20131203/14342_1 /TAXON_ID=186043 /ORGANISM="Entomoneis sp., Strain CCMP2396" /LENGTH=242 /DNA_ID=CAMNT_0043807633 /DNA_START=56 /DNA_END=784 /DNA_ORIENTATION=-
MTKLGGCTVKLNFLSMFIVVVKILFLSSSFNSQLSSSSSYSPVALALSPTAPPMLSKFVAIKMAHVVATITKPQREQLKKEILSLAAETQRGLTATPEQQATMDKLFGRLEKVNPTPNPLLDATKINGLWTLRYTTSDSILGKKDGFTREGPILQMLNVTSLTAFNSEVVNYFGVLSLPRKVIAELSPQSNRLTNVLFKRFEIGPLKIKAPESAQGQLDVTYLDETLRLSRGDKGNLFVLTK